MVLKKQTSKLGKLVSILIGIVLVYAFINSVVADKLIKRNGKCIKAYIYKETLGGKTSPDFGYMFLINSKIYKGLMSIDEIHKIGDSVCVTFYINYPNFNRPVSYFSEGEVKCDCK